MRVCWVRLDGFRNYEDFSVSFAPGVNVIWGENAQGKTNLLEAIGFLAGAKSHRARGDKELISFRTLCRMSPHFPCYSMPCISLMICW